MKKERMLITVSQEPEPPSHRKGPRAPKVKAATMVGNSKGSNSTENETSGKEKTIKTKSHKKKKKKMDGKKKKKKKS